jgi:hypothetical protein
MAQYPIPQFIESEGKIISFLTFKQFFWIVGGGAVCVAAYYSLPIWLFMPIVVVTGFLVVMIAFIKIDNMSVMTLLMNYISFSTKTKNYVWRKGKVMAKKPEEFSAKEPNQSAITNTKQFVEYKKKI